jgi:hypothetical protein
MQALGEEARMPLPLYPSFRPSPRQIILFGSSLLLLKHDSFLQSMCERSCHLSLSGVSYSVLRFPVNLSDSR